MCQLLTKVSFAMGMGVAVIGCANTAEAQLFVTPIGGVPYQDWTIVNYVDLDTTAGVRDYQNGSPAYTYNGHSAIDFTLPNFAKMDAGIPVIAAAAGTVTAVQDGFFDRCTTENPCPGGNANYIRIDHGAGLVTEYLHLRKNSPMVSVGQTVAQGEQIAWVGSSGNSSDAHLHFTVRHNGTAVETYLDPNTYWINPLPYSGDVPGALDFGVTDHAPTIPELRERPQDVAIFFADQANTATFWVNLHGIDNDRVRFRWYRPDGTTSSSSSVFTMRYGWRTNSLSLPSNLPGEWEVAAILNEGFSDEQELGRVQFHLVVPGDITTDGEVDQQDVNAFVAGWRYQQLSGDIVSWGKGDLNLDGKVDLLDAYKLNAAMGAQGAGELDFRLLTQVPEPTAAMFSVFAATSGFATLRRRHTRFARGLRCQQLIQQIVRFR